MPQLPLDELSTAIARIQGLLLTEEKAASAVRLLAKAAKDSVPATIGAGVSLLDSRGRRTSSGYTDKVVEQADAAQYESGEGSCLTAWAAEEPVLVKHFPEERRWPEWRSAVRRLPILSVVSAPLIAGKECIGTLKLYAATAHAYDGSSAGLLQLFAHPAATLLTHIQAREAPLRMSEALQSLLYSRDLVNRASGVLMERLGLGHEEALRQLMKRAREKNGSTLQHASESVLAGTPAPKA